MTKQYKWITLKDSNFFCSTTRRVLGSIVWSSIIYVSHPLADVKKSNKYLRFMTRSQVILKKREGENWSYWIVHQWLLLLRRGRKIEAKDCIVEDSWEKNLKMHDRDYAFFFTCVPSFKEYIKMANTRIIIVRVPNDNHREFFDLSCDLCLYAYDA